MPRFVILHHVMPVFAQRASHWDFMLKSQGVLRTWAMEELPTSQTVIGCQRLADHRLAYLQYEGPISRDRGTVSRWDQGEYLLELDTPERIVVFLRGIRLQGRVELRFELPADSVIQANRVIQPTHHAAAGLANQGTQRWTWSWKPVESSAMDETSSV